MIYSGFPTSMLTLGFLATLFRTKKFWWKEALSFSLTHLGHKNGAEREKSVAFKHYYLANDSSHRVTVLKLIRHSTHPQKRQRCFLVPWLCLRSLHMFSNIISCLLSDSSLNKGLLVHNSAHLPAEIVTYLWCLQIAGCLLFYFTVSCLPNAYQSSEGDSFPHLCR